MTTLGGPNVQTGASSQSGIGAETDAPPSLTEREVTVLRHLTCGGRNKEIAAALAISERTVKFHVSSLMTKLGARNRTEVVKVALLERLIDV